MTAEQERTLSRVVYAVLVVAMLGILYATYLWGEAFGQRHAWTGLGIAAAFSVAVVWGPRYVVAGWRRITQGRAR